jgi:hypothetical protein
MASATTHDTHAGKRTLAQWFCLLGGIAFLLAGIAGFAADSSFGTGDGVDGGSLLGLEVNGWHNIVHIASGLLLLAGANTAPSARIIAIVFGATYGLVTLWGLIDGNDILGLLAINGADNIFHLVTSALALAAGFLSPTRKSHAGRTVATDDRGADARGGRFERDAVGTGYAHEGQRSGAVPSTDRR